MTTKETCIDLLKKQNRRYITMMKQLRKKVNKLVEDEYALASKDHGARFHSQHEAYAVIMEEVEEAHEEMHKIGMSLGEFWKKCRSDSDGNQELIELETHAKNTICELIQVAAMAHKALQGYTEE